MTRRRRQPLSRIFARATPDPSGCLLLPGSGYRSVLVEGRLDRAHRLAWRLYHRRRVPAGRLVTHSCDRRPCIARAHLRLGTIASNAREAAERGRMRHGEAHPAARLREADVPDIRARYAAGLALQRELAIEHGVARTAIADVVHRRTWRHVEAA